MKFKQWQERKYEGERDPTLLPTWQEAITQVVKSEILYPRMPAILRRQQEKMGKNRSDQHSFMKTEPEDNLAKVEKMAQDMR
jgi:tryptophanyl-tRNA synthetase